MQNISRFQNLDYLRRLLRWVSAAVVVGLWPLAAAQTAEQRILPHNAAHEAVEAYIEQVMEEWALPGLAIAIVKDDSVGYVRGFGVREIGRPELVTPETLFIIASTSKAFTAAAIGALVDEGRMDWDDPVQRYLPWLRLADPWVSKEVTIRDLLAHRVGLAKNAGLVFRWTGRSRREGLELMTHWELASGFRSSYVYNNAMYLAAGEASAVAAGTSWDALIRERLFEPLGMERSSTSARELAEAENAAVPHILVDGNLVPDPVKPDPMLYFDNLGPAGSINSTVLDLAKWVRMQLGSGTFEGRRILSEATVAEMHAPQMVEPGGWYHEVIENDFSTYGLGWQIVDYRGRKVVLHDGLFRGTTSLVALLPEERLGVVVLANSRRGNRPSLALALRTFDEYTDGSIRDWSNEFLGKQIERETREAEHRADWVASRRKGTAPSIDLKGVIGHYANPKFGTIAINDGTADLRKLQLDWFGPRPKLQAVLEHWHLDTFRLSWNDPLEDYWPAHFATFEFDAQGNVSSVKLVRENGSWVSSWRKTAD